MNITGSLAEMCIYKMTKIISAAVSAYSCIHVLWKENVSVQTNTDIEEHSDSLPCLSSILKKYRFVHTRIHLWLSYDQ